MIITRQNLRIVRRSISENDRTLLKTLNKLKEQFILLKQGEDHPIDLKTVPIGGFAELMIPSMAFWLLPDPMRALHKSLLEASTDISNNEAWIKVCQQLNRFEEISSLRRAEREAHVAYPGIKLPDVEDVFTAVVWESQSLAA